MIANLKKSFKLLRYSYNFKGMMAVMAVLLAATIIIDILTFEFGYDLQILGNFLLFLALTVPLQLKEDLMLSQMLASSGFRRFFDVNFADVLLLLGSLASFWINAIVVLLLYKENPLAGNTAVGLLLSIGCGMGIITMFFSFLMKNMLLSIFMYFIVGIPYGMTVAFIEDLGQEGMLHISKGAAFVIGTCIVLVGNLIAMALRRAFYKKPLSKFACSEGLKKSLV